MSGGDAYDKEESKLVRAWENEEVDLIVENLLRA